MKQTKTKVPPVHVATQQYPLDSYVAVIGSTTQRSMLTEYCFGGGGCMVKNNL